jgi:PAS domain S-box-containing protein
MDQDRFQQDIVALVALLQRIHPQLETLSEPQTAQLASSLPILTSICEKISPRSSLPRQASDEVAHLLHETQRQQALLEAIYEADPGAIAVLTGPELRFAYVNPAYRFLCPDPISDPVGKAYTDVWTDQGSFGNRERLRKTMETGQPFQVSGVEHCFPDGETRKFQVQMRRIHWVGQPAVLMIMWDITAQKLAEDELEAAHRRNTEVLESISEAFYSLDEKGRFTYINRTAAEIWKIRPEDALGKDIWDVFPSGKESESYQRIREALEKHQSAHYESYSAFLDQWVDIHIYPTEHGISVFFQDITERKRSEQALQQALEKAETSQRLLDALMDYVPEGITIADAPDATIRRVSRFGQDILGGAHAERTAEAVAGEWKVYHPDGVTPLDTADLPLVRAIQKGEVVRDQDLVQVNAQGKALYLSCNAGPIRDAAGGIAGAVVAWRDLSEHRQVELQAIRNRATLEAALNSMTDAVFITNASGEFINFNEAFVSFHRFKSRAECGKTHKAYQAILDFIAPDGSPVPPADWIVPRALRGETATNAEYIVHRKDTGERWWASYNFAPILDENGDIAGSVIIGRDITAQKLAEKQLAGEKEWFRTTLKSIGDAVITTDTQGSVTFLNPVAERLIGQTNAEAAGQPIQTILNLANEKTHQPVDNPVDRVLESGAVVGLANHTELIRRDGRTIPIEDSAAPILDANGQALGVVMVFHDVTEKRKAEDALREGEERFRLISENSADVIWILDPFAGRFKYVSPSVKNLRGWTAEEVMSQPLFASLTPDSAAYVRDNIQSRLDAYRAGDSSRRVQTDVVQQPCKDGSVVTTEVVTALVTNAGGEVVEILGVTRDITERRRTEESEKRSAVQIELQRRLLEQREQERQQIARDLHDGPVQEITAAALALQGMLIDSTDPAEVRTIQEIQAGLQTAVGELRSYAQELRPPALSRFGLEKAIRSHLEGFQEKHTEPAIRFQAHQYGSSLPDPVRVALYRIYQEALINVLKHARATQVTIELVVSAREVILDIRDNGVGFEVPGDWLELARAGHLGLVGMRERAEAVGAALEVRSQVGEGAWLRVIAPLESPPDP